MLGMLGRLRLVLATLMASAVVIGGLGSGALARPDGGGAAPTAEVGLIVAANPKAGDVPEQMLAALQRDLKVTAEQARARLVRADWASRLDGPLRARLGPAYAGSWLAEDGQEFMVAFTDRRYEGLVRASGATPRLVARSEAELLAIGAKLGVRAKDPKDVAATVVGWVIDPQTNQVRVQVLPGGRAEGEKFVSAAGLTEGEVAYEVVPRQAQEVRDSKAGEPYFLANGARCSSGFSVVQPRTPGFGKPGYVTAAHCAASGDTYVPDLLAPNGFIHQGRYVAFAFGSEHDEAAVHTDPIFTVRPLVQGYGKGDVAVVDAAPQADGSPVCQSGSTTLFVCGTIEPGWHNPTFTNGVHKENLKATNICDGQGDSGGAVISASGGHAQGIHIAGNLCPLFFRISYYVPIQRVLESLSASLRVVPAPNSPPTPGMPSPKWTKVNKLWDGLGGSVKGNVSSVSLNAGHIQIFGRGTDDRLYTNISAEGVWGGWQGLGDVLTEPPSVIARTGGVIEVFYRGSDTRPYVRRFNGSAWEAPLKLGTIDVEGPIAAVPLYGGAHAALFIRSSNNEVYFAGHDGTKWSNWVPLGGSVNAAPTAIARPNGAGVEVLEVYARWDNDEVRYRRADPSQPGFQPWVNLGGIFREATPVGVTVGVNHSFLVGIAADHTMHIQQFRDGDWLRGSNGSISTGWRGVGGSLYSQPTAIAGPGEQIRVIGRDINQQINMITWRGGDIRNWERWVSLEGDTGVPVAVSRRASTGQIDLLDAFGVDATTLQPFYTTIDAGSATPLVAVNETAARVGEQAAFVVNGAPGAPVYWTSTKNGAVVEDHAFYGQYLDGDGRLVVNVGEWPGSAIGSWVKRVDVGTETQQAAQISYTVSPRQVTVATDKGQYQVGQNISYAVTGAPNLPIFWSSWINGSPSGESNAYYGQYTDGNGVFMVTTPWTDPRGGTWTKQVSVGGTTAQTSFDVTTPPPPPNPDALVAVHSGKCLSVEGGSLEEGAPVRQFTCSGATSQQWRPVGQTLRAVHSGKCLEANGIIAQGAVAQQFTCVDGLAQQAWMLQTVAESSTSRTVKIVSVSSRMCLTVQDASLADGATVYQWPCSGTANQLWQMRIPPPGSG